MKYKKGDRVRVKSLDWYNSNKNERGMIVKKGSFDFVIEMLDLCGKEFVIGKVDYDSSYLLKGTSYSFEDYMLEDISNNISFDVPSIDNWIHGKAYVCKVSDNYEDCSEHYWYALVIRLGSEYFALDGCGNDDPIKVNIDEWNKDITHWKYAVKHTISEEKVDNEFYILHCDKKVPFTTEQKELLGLK